MTLLVDVVSTIEGTVSHVPREVGDEVAPGTTVVVVEIMKMEQPVVAADAGLLAEVLVRVGDAVERGQVVARVDLEGVTDDGLGGADPGEAAGERADLAALAARRHLVTDAARPEVVARRHAEGSRTARENLADLLDDGSFVEYGALAHAAQRMRRSTQELQERTPADGIVTGLGTVGGRDRPVAVAAYDATVLAGTQGHTSHQKLDRILGVAHELATPFVLYAEGGGGRPGDTDHMQGAWLSVPTFRLLARLSGRVPFVSVVHGYCFAGNAAMAACADVVVATQDAVLGMAGPAMVAGGGLGEYDPEELGPVAAHRHTGAVDVVVEDEAAATDVARRVVSLLRGDVVAGEAHDQAELRTLVPTEARRPHDAGRLLELVADRGSLVELRPQAALGMRTALGRLDGRPVGLLANDPHHLAGAIDSEGAASAARLLSLCDAHGLPVVALVDTPGFMVGPDSDAQGAPRRTAELFLAGANLRVPLVAVVVRRAYGLGAMAMVGGDLTVPLATFAWPSASLGPMGLEGAVRLGARRELDAIADPVEREARVAALLAGAQQHASALNVATFAEIDDVIDPAETRAKVAAVLRAAPAPDGPRAHAHVAAW